MKINWGVRLLHKEWWLAMVPALLLAIQAFAKLFGYEFDFTVFSTNIIEFINALFALLVIMGVIIDPTTKGINDSDRAMMYTEPKEKSE